MPLNFFYKRIVFFAAMVCSVNCCFSQKSIAEWRADLDKASSAKAKADICFEIADRYATGLKIDSSLYFTNKIKEYSQQVKYESGIGEYYLALATAIFYRDRNDEAAENALKAIEIFKRQKDNILLGRAYLALGLNQNVTDKISLARKSYWTAVSYFQISDEAKGLYLVYRWLAYSYFKTSEIDSASFYQIKGLAMAERLKDPEKIYQAACWVGSTFLSLGELSKAIKYFEYGLDNRTSRSDKVGLRSILTDYATCLILTHKFTRADTVIKEVESLNALFKDEYGIAVINQLRGTAEYERKNYPAAAMYLQQAYNKMQEQEIINTDTKDIVYLLGKANYEMHSYDSAIHHLRLTAAISKELKDLIGEGDANLLVSKSFQQKGNTDSALYYFKNYSVIKDSILSQQKQKNIIEITAQYETEKKEQVIKILEKEKEADIYALALKNQQIEKQELESEKSSQQLQLLSQQSEISRLETAQKNVALQNQDKEMVKKQKELESISKENQLRKDIAIKESQQKWIAYGAVLAVLIFGSIAFFRYRQSRKLSKQLAASLVSLKEAQEQLIKTEKEKESENVRVRISRDIHDEVGATLSGVALYSEIAKQKMEEHKEKDAQVYLNHISANSKEMVEKISDIVWAINPDNDSFERIITKLQSYAFNLCAGKGIGLHMNIEDAVSKHYPSMQVKRNLYLFMKEAINNAVKYSEAKNISLSLQSKGDAIIAEIKDDGRGFDTSLNYMGNGLKNMKARAESVDGDFAIESTEGKGTCIRLRFQFHPTGGQPKKA